MPAEVPPSIQPLLEDYTRMLSERAPGLVDALYLQGSLALGSFNERLSDIDFVALLSHAAGEEDTRALAEVHRVVRAKYPHPEMQGAYLPWRNLGKTDQEPVDPYLRYDRDLHPGGPRGLDPVTWWLVKNRGIPLAGPDPPVLPFSVDWNGLVRWMAGNLHGYWGQWTRKPGRLVVLLSDWGVEWTVLGVLRQFYTFREGSIISKPGAGEYALTCLPARWEKIIHEALRIRAGQPGSRYRSRLARAVDTVRFLRMVFDLCDGASER